MYCGDGINDLVALAAADVGMAVGSSSASAAAAISDQHASVKGTDSSSSTFTMFILCLSWGTSWVAATSMTSTTLLKK